MSDTSDSGEPRCDHPECETVIEPSDAEVDGNWCSLDCFFDAKDIDPSDDDVIFREGL